MLKIYGDRTRFCDGVSRREFMTIGALAMGGLTLPEILATEAQAGVKNQHKAVIMIYLPGGIAHQDTFDMKMDAPSEMRGEFKPMDTNVSGIQITEKLPRLAKLMDKVAVIRSLVGARDEHANPLALSGFPMAEANQNHPCFGAGVSKIWGPANSNVPPFVDLIPKTQHKPYSLPAATGFLGRAYGAVKPDEQGAGDMVLQGMSLSRLNDRRRLLASVDHFRKMVDRSDSVQATDVVTQQAFEILTSRKFVDALDVTQESESIRKLYAGSDGKIAGDGCPCKNEHFLAARRLVQAGARCVTLGYGFWDFHGDNFGNLKNYLPMLEAGLVGLITDIYNQGLDKDVSVVVWGDFGRTPKINDKAGRDHWPAVASGLLFGGGLKTGQVIGSTTRDGGYADERPIHYRDVLATLYYKMGFDVRSRQTEDALGRPVYLLPGHEPIAELI